VKVLPLGEVCTLEYGKPLDKEFRKPDGAFQAFGANGPISSASKYLIDGPCVIVGRKGSAGEITYVKENVWPLDVTYYVKHDPKESDLRYLFYTLQNLDLKQFVRGVKPGLNRNDVYNLPIPLPSLEKQLEVVKKLDNAFAEIELAKSETIRSIQNLSNLLDSKLDEVFTMMEAECGMVQSGTIIDVRDGTHDSPSYVDSGYPLITSKNLQDGLIDFSKVSLISEEDYQQINKRSKVEAGDLLFAMIGTIGNPVVVKEDPLFAIKNVALFKGNPSYDMTFLSFYLRTPKIREKFEREAKGTTQRFLGLGYLRTLDIPNVPPENQLEIVRKLEQFESEIRKLELNLKQRLENFIELNNSIVSSMFTIDSKEEAVA